MHELCPHSESRVTSSENGFTLIELSIVLVIIGLIVGGVLVGRNLIDAAAVRAQISQIEKYQTAVNTFRGKYGYLPGDIPDPTASQFGFQPRGSSTGQGDGNGLIQTNNGIAQVNNVQYSCGIGNEPLDGEQGLFWVDLSTARLIDGSFSKVTYNSVAGSVYGSGLNFYLPSAKIGNGGYVYVWSGGWSTMAAGFFAYGGMAGQICAPSDGNNYFGVAAVNAEAYGMPLLTVAQAYAIDKKMDDGLPQYGNVLALDITTGGWAAGGPGVGTAPYIYESEYGDHDHSNYGPVTSTGDIATTSSGLATNSTYNCYDGGKGLPEQYSVANNSNYVNCVLSFKFQ